MNAADIEIHYYLDDQPIEPSPQILEDLDDGYDGGWDAFITQEGLVVEMRCTADGRIVYPQRGGQERACSGGHR